MNIIFIGSHLGISHSPIVFENHLTIHCVYLPSRYVPERNSDIQCGTRKIDLIRRFKVFDSCSSILQVAQLFTHETGIFNKMNVACC